MPDFAAGELAVMKDLSLRDILRYGVAGGVVLLAIGLIEGHASISISAKPVEGLGDATAMLAVALVIGAVLYSVHRALIFPFILRAQLRHSSYARKLLHRRISIFCPPVVSRREMRFDEIRLAEPEALKPRFSEWGDQVHLLYTSGEAIVLGILVDLAFLNTLTLSRLAEPHPTAIMLLVLSAALLLAGAVSHRRLLASMCMLLLRKRREASIAQQPA